MSGRALTRGHERARADARASANHLRARQEPRVFSGRHGPLANFFRRVVCVSIRVGRPRAGKSHARPAPGGREVALETRVTQPRHEPEREREARGPKRRARAEATRGYRRPPWKWNPPPPPWGAAYGTEPPRHPPPLGGGGWNPPP